MANVNTPTSWRALVGSIRDSWQKDHLSERRDVVTSIKCYRRRLAARSEQTEHDEHSPNAALRVEFTTSQIHSADGAESSLDACIIVNKRGDKRTVM